MFKLCRNPQQFWESRHINNSILWGGGTEDTFSYYITLYNLKNIWGYIPPLPELWPLVWAGLSFVCCEEEEQCSPESRWLTYNHVNLLQFAQSTLWIQSTGRLALKKISLSHWWVHVSWIWVLINNCWFNWYRSFCYTHDLYIHVSNIICVKQAFLV